MLLNGRQMLFLAVLTGILLWAAWPAAGIAPLLFVAFVPLLLVEHNFYRRPGELRKRGLFGYAYLSFFIFNLLTTWWIYYASLFGVIMAVIFNSLFMALAFQLAHFIRLRIRVRKELGYLPLIIVWVCFEYLHMNWDLSWSWLNLGNGFAAWYELVQWYEYTGVLGGTFWILLVNEFFAMFIIRSVDGDMRNGLIKLRTALILIMVPVIFSLVRYVTYTEGEEPVNVAIIQPNIDPYNEKFSGMTSGEQLDRILSLADSVADPSTDFIVAPETALPDGIWENDLGSHPHFQRLVNYLETKPGSRWVIGMASFYFYKDSTERSVTARRFREAPGYYDAYNTALYIEPDGAYELHHKSKLVPGVERLPFPALFQYFERFAIDLGGTTGSLGTQETPTVFKAADGTAIAPVICYESVYGDYVSKYVEQGASVIFIITNDGWWSDTPGYRQHLTYASLRAIEFRRSIARSANTGISAFLNQRGDILQPTGWWVPAAISDQVNLNHDRTLYSRIGDLIGDLCLAGGGTLLLLAFATCKKSG